MAVSNTVKCTNCNIVINEILAFIQNKLDVMDEVSLVRICETAFTAEDIERAKSLFFDSISSDIKKKIRKGAGKTQRNLHDVIGLLKQTDPDTIPIFVAKELQKLPPLTFDHVDVTRLLKDILVMQNEIKKIRDIYATKEDVQEVQRDLDDLKHASLVNNFQRNANVNTNKRGGQLFNNSNCDSGPIGFLDVCEVPREESIYLNKSSPTMFSTDSAKNNGSCRIVSELSASIVRANESACGTTRREAGDPPPLYALPAVSPLLPPPPPPQPLSTNTARLQSGLAELGQTAESTTTMKTLAEIVKTGEWKPQKPNTEWVTVQRKRLANRFTGNTGKAIPSSNINFKAAEDDTPMYIYKVSKDVTANDIISYVRGKTNLTVKVHKQFMTYEKRYDAYKVYIPTSKLGTFMHEDFWPEGIAFRQYIDFGNRRRGRVFRSTKDSAPHKNDDVTIPKLNG